MNELKVKDVIDYIMQNKRDRVYRTLTEVDIAHQVVTSLNTGMFFIAVNGTGIHGTMQLAKHGGVIHIEEILADNLQYMLCMVKLMIQQFPGVQFVGFKRGRFRKFNTQRFIRLIESTERSTAL